MRGYRVPRKAGWDCHGLPVELEVEKRLGIDGKEQIEEYGVAEFNELCRESVLTYLKDWDRLTERIGFWIDLDDAYFTLTNDYIESVWWSAAHASGTRACSTRATRSCPTARAAARRSRATRWRRATRTSTSRRSTCRFPLAPHAAAQVTGRRPTPRRRFRWPSGPPPPGRCFQRRRGGASRSRLRPGREPRRALRPRPRPGREGARRAGGRRARVRRQRAARARLRSLSYGYVEPDKRAHFVIGGDFVTTTDGTGIVHIAPAFGEDDMQVGPRQRPAGAQRRRPAGLLHGRGRRRGRAASSRTPTPSSRPSSSERGLLLGVEDYTHSYPFCWRCDTPLLYYAKATWYIRTTAVKDRLLAANEAINWYPEHIKHGRFGDWLENNVDWALSRDRYWGTPLPIWRCDGGHTHCVGSVAELRELAAGPVPDDLDLHRPYVDDVAADLSRVRRRDAPRRRGHRRLVRLRLDAVRAVALPVRERRASSASASRPTSSARRSTRRAAGSTACWPSPRSSKTRARTRTSSVWATSWTARARR